MPQFLFLFSFVLFSSTYSLSSTPFFFYFFSPPFTSTQLIIFISPFSCFICFVSSSSFYFISSTVNSFSLSLSLSLSPQFSNSHSISVVVFFFFFFLKGKLRAGFFLFIILVKLVIWANFCNFSIGDFVIRFFFFLEDVIFNGG